MASFTMFAAWRARARRYFTSIGWAPDCAPGFATVARRSSIGFGLLVINQKKPSEIECVLHIIRAERVCPAEFRQCFSRSIRSRLDGTKMVMGGGKGRVERDCTSESSLRRGVVLLLGEQGAEGVLKLSILRCGLHGALDDLLRGAKIAAGGEGSGQSRGCIRRQR